jgi:hypothetical protein
MDDDVTGSSRRLQEIVDLQQKTYLVTLKSLLVKLSSISGKVSKNQLKNSQQKLAKYHRSFSKKL